MSQSTTQQQHNGGRKSSDTARDTASRVAHSASHAGHEYAQHYVTEPAQDLFSLVKDYARDKPDVAAMWCFALGVMVGWKLKP
jgi:hypothetical protein